MRIGALFHGLQPVDEECKAKVATEMLGNLKFELKDDYGTHLEHRSENRTTVGLLLPPCPRAPLFPNLTRWCKVRIDRL